ncbi:MAG: guanylate kinase [Pseudomonadota bacterium]
MTPAHGTLYIVSAPSGAGKTSLVKALLQRDPGVKVSVSYTTRKPRPGETNGVEYHFVDRDTFLRMRDSGDFLEHAEVFGNFYGTSRKGLDQQLRQGVDVILEIDWQGAGQVRKLMQSVGIFILPPSREVLLQRLRQRAQDSAEVIARRTAEAIIEIRHCDEYDFVVLNDEFERALAEMHTIIQAQRLRYGPQAMRLRAVLDNLLAHS